MRYKNLLLAACFMFSTASQAKNDAVAGSNSQLAATGKSLSFFNKRPAGGYLSLGIGPVYHGSLFQSPKTSIDLQPNAAYYFSNGLFIEFPGRQNQFDGAFTLGYNLMSSDDWEFDLVNSMAHGEVSFKHQQQTLKKEAVAYLGLRAATELAGFQLQGIVAPYAENRQFNSGLYASVWLAKSWHMKNWHFNSSVGAQYRNSKMLDYYYGVPQASLAWPAYRASGGTNFVYKTSFIRPLSKHWTLDGYLSYSRYAGTILASPSVQSLLSEDQHRNNYGSDIGLSVRYVY